MIPATILYTGFTLTPKATPTTITARVRIKHRTEIRTAFENKTVLVFEDARNRLRFKGLIYSFSTGMSGGSHRITRQHPMRVEVRLTAKPKKL